MNRVRVSEHSIYRPSDPRHILGDRIDREYGSWFVNAVLQITDNYQPFTQHNISLEEWKTVGFLCCLYRIGLVELDEGE